MIRSRWSAVKRAPPSRSDRHSARARTQRWRARSRRRSRTSIGLTSTPSDGATDWIAPNWPIPVAYGGIPKDRHSRHARRDLLEQLQPFRAHAVFEVHEAGGVAARPRQAFDEAGADRIGDRPRTRSARCGSPAATVPRSSCHGQDDVRRERDQFGRVFANVVGIARGPADVDPHVAADGPARLLQPLQERRDAGLRFGIVCGVGT